MAEVLREILEAGLHIPEEELSKLDLKRKAYVLDVNQATKQFLSEYLELYTSSDKQKANECYGSWKRYIEREATANPDVAEYIRKISSTPMDILNRMASKDQQIKL